MSGGVAWGTMFADAASLAIAGGAVVGVGAWFTRHSWRGVGRVRRLLDDLEGSQARPGVPARPGVMERLQSSEEANVQILERLAAGDEANAQILERLATGDEANAQILERLTAGDERFGGDSDRLDAMEQRLGAFEQTLAHVASELPKNGKPAAEKLDYVYRWIKDQVDAAASEEST